MKLNEDFTNLYKRWSAGKIRKEDGIEVETPFGKMLLKNPKCDYEYYMGEILNDDGIFKCDFYNWASVSKECRNKIMNSEYEYIFLLDDVKNGTCVSFMTYEDVMDLYQDDVICEHDYKEICNCIYNYIKDNINIGRVKGGVGQYNFVLYYGDDEFDFDSIDDDIYNEYGFYINLWSYDNYNTYIGVDISFTTMKYYKEMKEFFNNNI